MWKRYKKFIYGFRRWTLMQGPRGPFYRVHSCSSPVVLSGGQLLLSVMGIVLSSVTRSLLCFLCCHLFLSCSLNVQFFPRVHLVLCSCLPCLFPSFVDELLVLLVCFDHFCNLGPYVQDGSCHILITQRGAALSSDWTVHPDVPYLIKTDHSKNLPQVPGLLCPFA